MQRYHFTADDLATVSLPLELGFKRQPPRPPELRQEGYEDEFDFHTISFDCFWRDETTAAFLGPPLANFEKQTGKNSFRFFDDKGTPLAVNTDQMTLRKGLRQHEWTISDAPKGLTTVEFNYGDLGTYRRRISASGCHLFAGKRVVVTLFKYDPMVWIREWAAFYAGVHGTNAILLYNNGSPNFTSAELLDALEDIEGIELAVVVDWPFKYGPQAGFSKKWDSTYCQTGALQHAFHKYLYGAKSVLNQDIDELALTPNQQSLHEMVETSETKFFVYPGIWATHNGPESEMPPYEERRHRDFIYNEGVDIMKFKCGDKWAVVPGHCPADAQWSAHYIHKMEKPVLPEPGVLHRHFRNLTARWKPKWRVRINSEPKVYQKDEALEAAFQRLGWRD